MVTTRRAAPVEQNRRNGGSCNCISNMHTLLLSFDMYCHFCVDMCAFSERQHARDTRKMWRLVGLCDGFNCSALYDAAVVLCADNVRYPVQFEIIFVHCMHHYDGCEH